MPPILSGASRARKSAIPFPTAPWAVPTIGWPIDRPARVGYWSTPAMAKRTQAPPKSFEDALHELEQILAEIEGGELGLEESLVKYERGNFLIHHCRAVLGQAEKQIELLSKSADGGLVATPMPERATAEAPNGPAPASDNPGRDA